MDTPHITNSESLKQPIRIGIISAPSIDKTAMGMAIEETLEKNDRLIVIGDTSTGFSCAEELSKLTSNHDGVVLAGNPNLSPNLEEIAQKAKEQINMLSLPKVSRLIQDNIPSKLEFLNSLDLTPEQVEYFKNSPPQRLEGETQEDYKNRRMINKLIIKFRRHF